ncbi:hypothetical protein GFD17_05080 [Bifidobacterium sp. SMB2]|uniref:Uncharacterized protein n=1 Tax=Bifidobacterium saimiriisciurei TaxID=2661627 RepID=A0ABX0C6J7_9BIFI|nr:MULTISPECIES: hypothetical protein [Bifidobacterium]NEG96139.1 hypothetical protein [Bifidobacterium sp. SMB2]NEH10783.1 hypothetical protein [Bifidobacterium saimiriisciurei]
MVAKDNRTGRDSRLGRIASYAVVVVLAAAMLVFVGVRYSWWLSLILLVVMVPAGLSTLYLNLHPERTGGRSMLGVSDASTLLDPFRGGRGTAQSRPSSEERSSDRRSDGI